MLPRRRFFINDVFKENIRAAKKVKENWELFSATKQNLEMINSSVN